MAADAFQVAHHIGFINVHQEYAIESGLRLCHQYAKSSTTKDHPIYPYDGRTTQNHSSRQQSFLTRQMQEDSEADASSEISTTILEEELDPSSLIDMDIVLYTTESNKKLQIGALQEDSTLAPLSAWTLDNPFEGGNEEVIEFVVDEEDRWQKELDFDNGNVKIHLRVEESMASYGSRQVGGGKGPGNPHGEESELLYYVHKSLLDELSVNINLKPELEILW